MLVSRNGGEHCLSTVQGQRMVFRNEMWWAIFSLGGGGGGRGEGNLRVILVRVCEPVFRNLPHSYAFEKTDACVY